MRGRVNGRRARGLRVSTTTTFGLGTTVVPVARRPRQIGPSLTTPVGMSPIVRGVSGYPPLICRRPSDVGHRPTTLRLTFKLRPGPRDSVPSGSSIRTIGIEGGLSPHSGSSNRGRHTPTVSYLSGHVRVTCPPVLPVAEVFGRGGEENDVVGNGRE